MGFQAFKLDSFFFVSPQDVILSQFVVCERSISVHNLSSAMATPHILRDRTLACQSLFSRCVSISFANTSRLDLFESWQGQFNLWAAGLKATQDNKSSLDYRVRHRADIRELMGDLLSGLAEALESCLHTGIWLFEKTMTMAS